MYNVQSQAGPVSTQVEHIICLASSIHFDLSSSIYTWLTEIVFLFEPQANRNLPKQTFLGCYGLIYYLGYL